jgi:hypothetical protein
MIALLGYGVTFGYGYAVTCGRVSTGPAPDRYDELSPTWLGNGPAAGRLHHNDHRLTCALVRREGFSRLGVRVTNATRTPPFLRGIVTAAQKRIPWTMTRGNFRPRAG